MNDTKPRAITRTWTAAVTYRECSVVTGHSIYSVTLSREAEGVFTAEVDGQPAEVLDAARILASAHTLTVTHEELEPAPIGKARARQLHILMTRRGVPAGEHYAFASAALDAPVFSLAALCEVQARTVWRFLCSTHPAAA